MIQKIVAYLLSVVYYVCFGFCLVVFHPIQWICLRFFGYQAHKTSVDILQFFIMRCLNILGTRFSFTYPEQEIPKGVPLIIVANHQSTYDIPPIIWYMRKYHPKFISKKELGKGIPSVSFNLRHGGSVLIDRKDPKQAIMAIKKFAQQMEQNKTSAVIFPEGTRSRDGQPKKFATSGLKMLIKNMPSAYVVPISITNSWKTFAYGGQFPMGLGAFIKFKAHKPLAICDYKDIEQLVLEVEKTIVDAL